MVVKFLIGGTMRIQYCFWPRQPFQLRKGRGAPVSLAPARLRFVTHSGEDDDFLFIISILFDVSEDIRFLNPAFSDVRDYPWNHFGREKFRDVSI